MRGHRRAVRAILPLASGGLVSGGDDGRLIFWRDGQIQAQRDGAAVTAQMLFQGRVVSGHTNGRLRVWSADTLHVQPPRLTAPCWRLLHMETNWRWVSDAASWCWIKRSRHVEPYPPPHAPRDLQFSPDGHTLAAGGWFRLNLWDMASGAMQSIPTEHNGLLTSIAFSPDGRYLATLGRHTDSASAFSTLPTSAW